MIDEGSFCTGCHLSHKTPQHSHRLPPCSYSLKTITISEFGAHIDKLLKLRNKKFGCFWANPFTFICICILYPLETTYIFYVRRDFIISNSNMVYVTQCRISILTRNHRNQVIFTIFRHFVDSAAFFWAILLLQRR